MKLRNVIPALVLMIAGTLAVPRASAQGLEQATVFTFSQPVEIPGQSLPAGTYVFAPDESDTNVVRVFNSDRSSLIATLGTIPTKRPDPAGEVVVSLAQQGSGQPDALISWFDPGEITGHELEYPSKVARTLAADTQRVVNGNNGMTISPSEPTASGD